MSNVKKILLSHFCWEPLGVGHCTWRHKFLIPQNFANGVTTDKAIELTSEWLLSVEAKFGDETIRNYALHLLSIATENIEYHISPDLYEMLQEYGYQLYLDRIIDDVGAAVCKSRDILEYAYDQLVDTYPNVTFSTKDITNTDYGVIAQGVNCQGAMGSGVARAILRKWPLVYQQYINTFNTLRPTVGYVDYVDLGIGDVKLLVANCYTQEYFGADGRRYGDLDAVEKCLTQVLSTCDTFKLPLHLPRIASDLAGLSWLSEVQPLILKLSKQFPSVSITIHILGQDLYKY